MPIIHVIDNDDGNNNDDNTSCSTCIWCTYLRRGEAHNPANGDSVHTAHRRA